MSLTQTRLTTLMNRTAGRSSVRIGLIDGPVRLDHPGLARGSVQPLTPSAGCTHPTSRACEHGTFVAGILSARRTSGAPAICPECTLLVRTVFGESSGNRRIPESTPSAVAQAIVDCLSAGARVINLSLGVVQRTTCRDRALEDALDLAVASGAIVVAAAGNQGAIQTSAITRHAGVLPVTACDRSGRPTTDTNLSHLAARRGLSAPGDAIMSLAPSGLSKRHGGTSAAAAFVTGTIALLWSEYPRATVQEVWQALRPIGGSTRSVLTPPLLNAEMADLVLGRTHREDR